MRWMEDRVRFPIAVLYFTLTGEIMDYPKKIVTATLMLILPVFLVALAILLLFLVPWLFVWSVNLLFATEIEFNFWNSVAIYVLIGLFSASRVRQ